MNWKKARLVDCCISITDGDHQPPPKADTGIPFITIANINSYNQIEFTNSMFVPKDYYMNLNESKRAIKDDILYSVVGSFGIPVFLKDDMPFVFQRHIALLRPNKDVLYPKFLYYKMLSRDFYQQADTVAIGAAQRTIGLASLRKMIIEFPVSYKEQEKIANVLSAYDDLIENNQKQIKLLEEAAQRLYKEWFVDLRFPGHEQTKIVDGVPEGWAEKTIKDISSIQTGKRDANYGIEDGQYPFFTCAQTPIKAPSYSFDGNAVILAGNGDFNVKLFRGKFEAYQRTYVILPNNINTLYLIYHAININMRNLIGGASGSTIKFFTKGMIETIKVKIPTQNIFDRYFGFRENMQRKIEELLKKNILLTEARDRLLPKLMNGEIEV